MTNQNILLVSMTTQRLKIKNDVTVYFFPLPHIHRSAVILMLSLTHKVKLFYSHCMSAQDHKRVDPK